MRRSTLHALAAAVVLAGGVHLGVADVRAATATGPGGTTTGPSVSCSGGTRAQPCKCTSGDGKAVCTGSSCTADATGCTYTGFPKTALETAEHLDELAAGDASTE